MRTNDGQGASIKKYILLAVLVAIVIVFTFDVPSAAFSNQPATPGDHVTASLADPENVIYKPNPPPEDPVAVRQRAPIKRAVVEIRPASDSVHPISKDEVIALIEAHAASYGLDPALPLAIAKCESGFRWDAKNAGSTASGVFQYLAGTWANTPAGRQGISVFDADANIRMAIAAIATSGTAPWNASKSCWNT